MKASALSSALRCLTQTMVAVAVIAASLRSAGASTKPAAESLADVYTDYEEQTRDGDAASKEELWAAAVHAYFSAYESLSPSERTGGLGRALVDKVIGLSHHERFLSTAQVPELKHAILLVDTYVSEVEATDPTQNLQGYRDEGTRLTVLLQLVEYRENPVRIVPDRPSRPEPPPPLALPDPPKAMAKANDLPASAKRPQRGALARWLEVSGGITLATGVGLTVAGARFSAQTDRDLARRPWDGDEERLAFESEQARKERTYYIVGGSLLGVGLGLVAGGVALEVLGRKKAKRSVAAFPTWTGSSFGIGCALKI